MTLVELERSAWAARREPPVEDAHLGLVNCPQTALGQLEAQVDILEVGGRVHGIKAPDGQEVRAPHQEARGGTEGNDPPEGEAGVADVGARAVADDAAVGAEERPCALQ